ncbi:tyrosine-type recombinase/integrase [Aporhodopirellula aestuarii]|uniref:Site-specific integrase n=1 Tax=Aporhodopirellula aestuarii TaxID=2950107 RepID=A0ABT0U0I2_9BACT|nr:tyrosine-type recombinase/integrase [Aporhodopirellula aestuarii]MCM2370372.1 site-specific integrase [Aporhodopirellula aestuarii]
MSRPKKVAPDYRYHVSGQAVVTFNGTNFYLGPHNSPESKAKYRRLVAEYVASDFQTPDAGPRQAEVPILVADVTAEARDWINSKYANCQSHRARFLNLCNTLDDEYGDTTANEFGPRKLSEIRDLFVASGNSRRYVNSQIRSIVRIFRYALSRELIDANVIVRLDSLESLRYGQTSAKEPKPVTPVNLADVRATAEHLSPVLKVMIRVQVATGMRPGEMCRIRPADIEVRPGDVWVYCPANHKTARLGKKKAVPIVGDAREALEPFMNRDPDKYCFSPKESTAWYRQQRTLKRKTPANCGDRVGHKRGKTLKGASAKRTPGDFYDKDSYRHAIQRAAEKAGVPHWFPYQLRHTAGTAVREALGVEAAQALLGHSRAAMTEHYAKVSESKAIEAAKSISGLGLCESTTSKRSAG